MTQISDLTQLCVTRIHQRFKHHEYQDYEIVLSECGDAELSNQIASLCLIGRALGRRYMSPSSVYEVSNTIEVQDVYDCIIRLDLEKFKAILCNDELMVAREVDLIEWIVDWRKENDGASHSDVKLLLDQIRVRLIHDAENYLRLLEESDKTFEMKRLIVDRLNDCSVSKDARIRIVKNQFVYVTSFSSDYMTQHPCLNIVNYATISFDTHIKIYERRVPFSARDIRQLLALSDGCCYIVDTEGAVNHYDSRTQIIETIEANTLMKRTCQKFTLDDEDRLIALGVYGRENGYTMCYRRNNHEWEQLPEIPVSTSGFDATCIDGDIYIIGGARFSSRGSVSTNSVWCCRKEDDYKEWNLIEHMIIRRNKPKCFVIDGHLVVYSGDEDGIRIKSFESLSLRRRNQRAWRENHLEEGHILDTDDEEEADEAIELGDGEEESHFRLQIEIPKDDGEGGVSILPFNNILVMNHISDHIFPITDYKSYLTIIETIEKQFNITN